MITTCTHCNARYQLDGAKVPRRMIRVRCPGCQGVFQLDGMAEAKETLVGDTPSGFVTGFSANVGPLDSAPSSDFSEREIQPSLAQPAQDPLPAPEPSPEPSPEPAPAPIIDAPVSRPSVTPPLASEPASPLPAPSGLAAPSVPAAQMDPPTVAAPVGGRRHRSKEEMQARALVSDILVYNRELRDTALAEGNLVEAMGAEIKKSWELYKEKVTPEVANSNDYFREALNEILAEGNKIF